MWILLGVMDYQRRGQRRALAESHDRIKGPLFGYDPVGVLERFQNARTGRRTTRVVVVEGTVDDAVKFWNLSGQSIGPSARDKGRTRFDLGFLPAIHEYKAVALLFELLSQAAGLDFQYLYTLVNQPQLPLARGVLLHHWSRHRASRGIACLYDLGGGAGRIGLWITTRGQLSTIYRADAGGNSGSIRINNSTGPCLVRACG